MSLMISANCLLQPLRTIESECHQQNGREIRLTIADKDPAAVLLLEPGMLKAKVHQGTILLVRYADQIRWFGIRPPRLARSAQHQSLAILIDVDHRIFTKVGVEGNGVVCPAGTQRTGGTSILGPARLWFFQVLISIAVRDLSSRYAGKESRVFNLNSSGTEYVHKLPHAEKLDPEVKVSFYGPPKYPVIPVLKAVTLSVFDVQRCKAHTEIAKSPVGRGVYGLDPQIKEINFSIQPDAM